MHDKNINEIIKQIKDALLTNDRVFVAIDGRCASGKTTLAGKLAKEFNAFVIHIDDFYVPRASMTEQMIGTPSANIDRSRLITEVLEPAFTGQAFDYRAYDCKNGAYLDSVLVTPSDVFIIEGAYSCHPDLYSYYDFAVFMDVDSDLQLKRLEQREGKEKTQQFIKRWIPLEEEYFKTYKINDKCVIYIKSEEN